MRDPTAIRLQRSDDVNRDVNRDRLISTERDGYFGRSRPATDNCGLRTLRFVPRLEHEDVPQVIMPVVRALQMLVPFFANWLYQK